MEDEKQFDFKDNVLCIKGYREDSKKKCKVVEYEIIKDGVTTKGEVSYTVTYDKNNLVMDPWIIEHFPAFHINILDGGEDLPKKVYGYFQDFRATAVRDYGIDEILNWANPDFIRTYALNKEDL